jgi:hypothetical protein
VITYFSVSNFKSFNSEFSFDFKNTHGYNFNKESIKNNIVNNALVYGHNGVGKSNLGIAIFDIIGHLTEKNSNESEYSYYLNALNTTKTAKFKYEFLINTDRITYIYEKTDVKNIVSESFFINDKELASIDRRNSDTANISFMGTESLKKDIKNKELSILKYVKNNSVLDDNKENTTFLTFFKFIEGMLFFRSLQDNIYLGLEIGSRGILEDIIEKDNVYDFEDFLNRAGIECKLTTMKETEEDTIAFEFEKKKIPFYRIASQGTRALSLFYYWFQRLKEENKVTFLFIDEFDAFYHHELSALIVEELKKTGIQFILTTHNTSIITNDLLRPDCYFLMNKERIKSLAKSTPKELREAHNIEKMYKAGKFNV